MARPDRLAARGQQDFFSARVDRRARRAKAFDRLGEAIERRLGIAGVILYRKAGDARPDAEFRTLMDLVRRRGEARLEIGVERQGRGVDEVADMVERIGARDPIVRTTGRESHAGARRRQGLEAKRRQIDGRADVPGIGDDEAAGAAVQFRETLALLADGRDGLGVNVRGHAGFLHKVFKTIGCIRWRRKRSQRRRVNVPLMFLCRLC
jgi:hypothetical protein